MVFRSFPQPFHFEYFDRLAGAGLVAPAINYWWPGLPANLSKQALSQQLVQDQWTLRVAHYVPWLTYWWNTQKWFPSWSLIAHSQKVLSPADLKVVHKLEGRSSYMVATFLKAS